MRKQLSKTGARGAAGQQGPVGQQGPAGQQGPTGIKGADGVGLTVKDATGATLGRLLGAVRAADTPGAPRGPGHTLLAADGGVWTFRASAVLSPDTARPYFLTSDRSGSVAYMRSTVLTTSELSAAYGTSFRLVFRPTSNAGVTFDPAQAWKGTTSTATTPGVAMYTYTTDAGGAALFTGSLVELASVTAPADVQGPLKVE